MARTSNYASRTTTVSASTAVSAFAGNPGMAPVAISDTTSSVGKYLDGLQGLAAAGKITSISLSDTRSMTIKASQFFADTDAIAFLPLRQMLIVTGAKAAEANAIQADSRVRTFQVADTPANISTWLDALNNDTKLTSVSLSGAGAITMSHQQLLTNTFVLGKLSSGATYAVSAVTVAGAASVQAMTRVVAFTVAGTAGQVGAAEASLAAMTKITAIAVSDNAANVLANLDGLDGLTTLNSIVLTDTDVLSVTQAQYAAQGTVLERLAPEESLAVTGVSAAAAVGIAAESRVTAVSVADTLANIGANLGALDALADAGELTAISVTDSGGTLPLSAEDQADFADAIALMSGSFTIETPTAPAAPPDPVVTKPPVINLIWDESVDLAPVAFKQAVQTAASFFDALITSPITVNIEVGWGEARDTALGLGLLGEAYATTGLFRSFNQYKTDLAAHATSSVMQSAVDNLVDPGRQIFVPGAQAKALGQLAADAPLTDGAIGFASNAMLYTYDPGNRAVAGKIDLIGLAQHEITHALGRISYSWGTTGFDLYRYSAPGAWATASSGSTYFSVDGGQTNLGTFSMTGDPADWGPAMASDVQAAFLGTGIAFTYSEADIVALNAMGFAMGTEAAAPTGTTGDGTVIDPMAGSSAAHMAFETPTEAQAAYEPAPWDLSADLFGANPMATFEEAPTASFGMPDWRMASMGESLVTGGSEHF